MDKQLGPQGSTTAMKSVQRSIEFQHPDTAGQVVNEIEVNLNEMIHRRDNMNDEWSVTCEEHDAALSDLNTRIAMAEAAQATYKQITGVPEQAVGGMTKAVR